MSQEKRLWPTPNQRDYKDTLNSRPNQQTHLMDAIRKSPLSPAVSPVSLTRLRDSVRELMTSVTSGRSSGVSLAKLDQDGSWLKMYRDSFQLMLDGSLEKWSPTWPRWGTLLDGVVTELLTWGRYTGETGCLLLGTPRATEAIRGKTTDENEETWRARQAEGKVSTPPLNLAVKMWPTPKGTPSGPDYARQSRPESGGNDLVTEVGGQLNPTWVEWLMGFPPGWTDLDASETP